MFEVTYIVKDMNGFIKEQRAKFDMFHDAIKFVRAINGGTLANLKVVGKPTVERV
jgi:hypothetical protein